MGTRGAAGTVPLVTVPEIPEGDIPPAPEGTQPDPAPDNGSRKGGARPGVRREPGIARDTIYTVERDGHSHIVSENYYYKTEPYYTILRRELNGEPVRPPTREILDAIVVPICLERAKLAGIPVAEWGISQGYVPLPAIIYGLNYFATAHDYFVVNDNPHAKEVIKHVTNKGKYPFCYQHLPGDATIISCPVIFGKTEGGGEPGSIGSRVYEIFRIPLFRMILIGTGSRFLLSSISPVRYSELDEGERSILSAYIAHQEFL